MKKAFLFSGIAVCLFIGVLLFNTFRFNPANENMVSIIHEPVSDDAILRFQKGIQFPTISNESFFDSATFYSFHQFLEEEFPLVHQKLAVTKINNLSLIYHWRGQEENQLPALLLAHMDVVPVQESNLPKWTEQPFSGVLKDNKIWGRGTLDNKNTLIGILEATESLLAEGFTPKQSIYYAFGHDEETGGEEGAVNIANYFKANNIRFDFIIDEGMVVLTDGISNLNKNIALIGLSEKGLTTMTLKVVLENGGHGMMPPKETAIMILSEALVKLNNNPPPVIYSEGVRKMFDIIGREMKWPEKIIFANQWIFRPIITSQLTRGNASNALIKTTLAPTIISGGIMDNVLPAEAEVTLNIRIVPGETVASIKSYVEKTINDNRIEISIDAINKPRDPTPISPTDHHGYDNIAKSILEVFENSVVAPSLVIAGTDSRHYQELTNATYRFMPVKISNSDLEGIHGVNENITIDNYHNTIKFFRRLIQNLNY